MYSIGFYGLILYCANADKALSTSGMTVSSRYALIGRVSKLFLFPLFNDKNYLTHFLSIVYVTFLFIKFKQPIFNYQNLLKKISHKHQTFYLCSKI